MEKVKPGKCRFFKAGQPSSCTNKDKCPFLHQETGNSKPAQEDHHSSKNERPLPYSANTHKEKEGSQHYTSNSESQKQDKSQQKEIKDPETKQKVDYITDMMRSLRKICLRCKVVEHLVLTSCGCQKICRDCASTTENCPACKSHFDHKMVIGVFS